MFFFFLFFGRSLTVGLSKRPFGYTLNFGYIFLFHSSIPNAEGEQRLKSPRRFLLLISIIFQLLIEVSLSQTFSTSENPPLRMPYLPSVLQDEPNTDLAASQYRALLGFFLRFFSEVEKSLIKKIKKLFLAHGEKLF